MSYLRNSGVDCSNLEVGDVREFEWGWSVHVNTPNYWKTRDMMSMVIGLSPVFVSIAGSCMTYPTGLGYEEMITRFVAEHVNRTA